MIDKKQKSYCELSKYCQTEGKSSKLMSSVLSWKWQLGKKNGSRKYVLSRAKPSR